MMEPRVCLLFIKLDFVTRFTGFCEAKISEYDIYRFGTINIPTFFVFCVAEIWSSDWVGLFLHQYQKNIPAFSYKISAE